MTRHWGPGGAAEAVAAGVDRDWWRGAVIYQIYPGFSESDPWLPMAMEHLDRAVSLQERDPESMLNFHRALLDFRRAHPILKKDSMTLLRADDDILAFLRKRDGRRMLCAFNLTGEDRVLPLPEGDWRQDRYAPFEGALVDGVAELPPYQGLFALELE